MRKRIFHIVLILVLGCITTAHATHIVGGEVYYRYLKDTIYYGVLVNKYEITLNIYEDCQNGSHDAIAMDNPAKISIFDSLGHSILQDTIEYISHDIIPANFTNSCIKNPPTVCLLKTTFVKDYYLPPSNIGYVIAYQRCCRNGAIVNIFDPSGTGATFVGRIPPKTLVAHNNSAVFTNFPPQIICANNPLVYDNSATDADGDSLSYEFSPSLAYSPPASGSGSTTDFAAPPPYSVVAYVPPYSYLRPLIGSPLIQINSKTGLITGTPTVEGRYLVTMCCHEWRGGKLINTVTREFQFVVTNCSKLVVADMPQYSTEFNTYIVDCKNYTVNFENTSSGGTSYHWDFGVEGATYDTSNQFEPAYTYPDTGVYVVLLRVNPTSTCQDSIWRYVKVYPYFTSAYTDSGLYCPNDPISFYDKTTSSIQPANNWTWSFGDGTYAVQQNLVHTYSVGGSYQVMMTAGNDRSCRDTMVSSVIIENFKPFAGHDTIIVKDESVFFNAQGGVSYSWYPSTFLNDTGIYNPVGYYPDTGTFMYEVFVTSAYGCTGYDTMKVEVVGQPSFFVPSAFSPNGDGKNDYFRPLAVGYRELNYFKIFDRWGQMVYFSKSFETGWDGTFNGKKMDLGTYFWEIGYTDRFGKPGTRKGDVTLVR